MTTDPISDLLIRLKNAAFAKRSVVEVPFANLNNEISRVLTEIGYVKSLIKKGKRGRKLIELELLKSGSAFKLKGAERVSKPSRRIYQGFRELKPVRRGLGHLVLSTPSGVMTGREARKLKLGGEVLFKIW